MRNMMVVISDLHFEEEKCDIISDPLDRCDPIVFQRNVPASAFEDMMNDIALQARSNGAARIDLVLAGDIIDLYRTQCWFQDDKGLRPYVDCRDVTPVLEAKLLAIMDAIVAEPQVARSIAVFRRFADGEYLEAGSSSPGSFGIPTAVHYLPGNHDRLLNATPALRRRVCELFGIKSGPDPFAHQILSADPPVLIRHGHEYDRYNFAGDLKGQWLPAELSPELYDQPTWGDYNTVMIAARLPFLFRRYFTDAEILRDPVLQVIYCRLLEFDDVRPQSAVLDFFLNTTIPAKLEHAFGHREELQARMWAILKPVVRLLLDEVVADALFRRWIGQFFPIWAPLLLLRPWRLPLPLWLVRRLGRLGRASDDNPSEPFAAHEKEVHGGSACFLCAGHTHRPGVAHIYTRNDLKRYFTDTGTWRNAVLSAGDKRSYGRLNATTYVTFYGKERDGAATRQADHGFEFWTGFDQTWPVDSYDH